MPRPFEAIRQLHHEIPALSYTLGLLGVCAAGAAVYGVSDTPHQEVSQLEVVVPRDSHQIRCAGKQTLEFAMPDSDVSVKLHVTDCSSQIKRLNPDQ